MRSLAVRILSLFALFLLASTAQATLYTGEVAEDAYVTVAGYDLAWASPCSDGLLEYSCGAIDMSEQSGYGWNIMTSDLVITSYSIHYTKLYEFGVFHPAHQRCPQRGDSFDRYRGQTVFGRIVHSRPHGPAPRAQDLQKVWCLV